MDFEMMDGNGNSAPDIGTRILGLIGRRLPQPPGYPPNQALPGVMPEDRSLGRGSSDFALQQPPSRTLRPTTGSAGLVSGSYGAGGAPMRNFSNASATTGEKTGSSIIPPYGPAPQPPSTQPTSKKSHSKTPENLATDADINSGTYVEVGFRRTQDWKTGHLANHAYIGVPELQGNRWVVTYYEVLGNEHSSKNQEVRNSSDEQRHRPGTTKFNLAVSPAQKEALLSRLKYFADKTEGNYSHPCPSCGTRYHAIFPEPWNSNTFVYNMLIHNPAGRIEPPQPPHALFGTPGYKVNAPNEHWYQ